MRSKLLLIGLSSFLSLHLYASCINEVRQGLLDQRIGTERIGSSKNIDSYILRRLKVYKRKAMQEIGYERLDIELNSLKNNRHAERLIEALSLHSLPKNINTLLEHFWNNHNHISYQQNWLSNLYKEIIITTYVKGSPKIIERFETESKVSEKIILEVLLNRLSDTGLNTKAPERVWSSLSPSNFGELLLERKVIIDEGFRGKAHGHLIHLIQMDLLRFTALDLNLSPRVVGETIEFIGRNSSIVVEDFNFKPIDDIWDVLFDSTERDFSTPEVLNVCLEKFFGWRDI